MTTTDQAEHPRPQLTRRRWTDLCGEWGFAYDDADVGLDADWCSRAEVFDRTINVPFPPESPASGVGDRGFHPVVWYRRSLRWSPAAGERLLLHFGAVDYRASVWVNGSLVARHEGGHTPFSADITAALDSGGEQIVAVRAEDAPTDLGQPRGKQDWQERPHNIFYERTTGIWQPVWLEPVPPTSIATVRWLPDVDRGVLGVAVELSRTPERPLRLRVALAQHGRRLADDVYSFAGATLHREVALYRPDMTLDQGRVLWSPDHPNLVDAELTLLDGDEPVDVVRSYAGLRTVRASGGRFVLNSRPYFLRMVLEQGYWPQTHLAAPSAAAIRREVELIKELGFNGVRLHQKVEDPRFLYWCDRLGLIVWGEMANAYEFSRAAIERLTREWLEVLHRDVSSPSIVAWVPLNESWGVPNLESEPAQRDLVRALYHLTKAIDPSRLTIGNDGWEHTVSDIFSIHDYSSDGAVLRERYGSGDAVERTLHQVQPHYRSVVLPGFARHEEPLMVTEFGGSTFDASPEKCWNGYGAVTDAASLAKKYQELVSALLDSPVIAGFCYTQLTDTGQERNGLLDENRVPKFDIAAIRQITTAAAAAVPADAIANIQILHADRPAPDV